MDLYEAVETICKDYCKYPDIESGNKLADICDKCPMNKCEDLRWADRKTEPMKTTDYCDICKRDMCEDCIADATNPYCVPSHYEINYEPKDEPKTQMKTQNSNLTFENRTMLDCYNCKRYKSDDACVECRYEPIADTPQTERSE